MVNKYMCLYGYVLYIKVETSLSCGFIDLSPRRNSVLRFFLSIFFGRVDLRYINFLACLRYLKKLK